MVAAEAEGGLPAGRTTTPIHKLVLIQAERGLGKTRLAMELYRHLTETRDPGGYWPIDSGEFARGLSVMPRANDKGFKYEVALPFLWLGLAVDEAPNPGNTLFASLGDLGSRPIKSLAL